MELLELDVDIEKVKAIFTSAFMDVSESDADSFLVKGLDCPFPIRVTLDTSGRGVLRFSDLSRLYNVSENDAAIICNNVCRELSLLRCYAFIIEGTLLVANEYEMSVEKGVIPFQVVSNFRVFEKALVAAVRNHLLDYMSK